LRLLARCGGMTPRSHACLCGAAGQHVLARGPGSSAAIHLDRRSRRCRVTPAAGSLADVRSLWQCNGGFSVFCPPGAGAQAGAASRRRPAPAHHSDGPAAGLDPGMPGGGAAGGGSRVAGGLQAGSGAAWRSAGAAQRDGRQLGQAEGPVAAGVVPGASLLLLCTRLPDGAARRRLCAGLRRQRRRRRRRRMPSRAVLPQQAAAGQSAAGRRSAAALQAGWPPAAAAAAAGVRRARAQRGGAPLRRRAAGVRGRELCPHRFCG